jgi:4-hydroxy-2-oxoheptanedioate aldolase
MASIASILKPMSAGGDAKAAAPVDAADVAKLGMAAYRAPSLFQPHRAREALADAHAGKIKPILGYFMGLASPPIAKLVALFGFDMVWIDWEHAAMNVETMTQVRAVCSGFYLIY